MLIFSNPISSPGLTNLTVNEIAEEFDGLKRKFRFCVPLVTPAAIVPSLSCHLGRRIFSTGTRLSRGATLYFFSMLIRSALYRLHRDRLSLQKVSAVSKPRDSRVDAREKTCQESAGY